MTLILDAGPLIAMADETDPRADAVHGVLTAEQGDWVVPAYVAAEADYLIGTRIGRHAQRIFFQDLASGTYVVEALTPEEHQLAAELSHDLPELGLADLSMVVLSARYRTNRLLTFDERDFRTTRPLDGDHFVLLPADLDRG